MNLPAEDDDPNAASRRLGETFAAVVGQREWAIDNPEGLVEPAPVGDELPIPEPSPVHVTGPSQAWIPAESEIPPTPRQIVEALLFVSDEPVILSAVCTLIRGLQPRSVLDEISELNRLYIRQHRPYSIVPRGRGYLMELLPAYRSIQAKLREGGRTIALPPPALEVLSLVAYQQPVTPFDIDRLRGGECLPLLRQLIKHGLVHCDKAADKSGVYSTTDRFLEFFGLRTLDDLPRLASTDAYS